MVEQTNKMAGFWLACSGRAWTWRLALSQSLTRQSPQSGGVCVCSVIWVLLYHSSTTGQAVVLLLGIMQVQFMKLKQKAHDREQGKKKSETPVYFLVYLYRMCTDFRSSCMKSTTFVWMVAPHSGSHQYFLSIFPLRATAMQKGLDQNKELLLCKTNLTWLTFNHICKQDEQKTTSPDHLRGQSLYTNTGSNESENSSHFKVLLIHRSKIQRC